MGRISSPLESMKSHYRVVVVGSGYGGSIAASRLARAGQEVCLLERGKELISGEYPDNEGEALREMQVDLPGKHLGLRHGLYDFRVNPDINVFVGCGLGGTSLVNANVALRPEPWVFTERQWPRALREDTLGLNEGFRRAETMLAVQPFPAQGPRLAKFEALKRSATAAHPACRLYRPPLAVTFADQKSPAGVPQKGCNFESYNKSYAVNRIINYLNENYDQKISLEQIAHNMFLSPVYISKIFKEETGESPINYLIKIRLEKAKDILLNSVGGSIKSIANQVGYDDVYHFSKLFKKYYGISPLYYKKRAQQ